LSEEKPYGLKRLETKVQLISYQSGDMTLHGFLYAPRDGGRFPVVIYNHGSNRLPGEASDLAEFYSSNGFVFFFPHRHGHGRSPGAYISDLGAEAERSSGGDVKLFWKQMVKLHELYNEDVVAAVSWLRNQNFVDESRIVMSGVSYGGIQTLLTAEKGLGIRSFIPFAPAAMTWANTELQKRLVEAVRKAEKPIFLIQAQNDFNLGPSQILGAELERKGPPNQAKIYPSFGNSNQEGHGKFATIKSGIEIWGPDVLDFIHRTLQ